MKQLRGIFVVTQVVFCPHLCEILWLDFLSTASKLYKLYRPIALGVTKSKSGTGKQTLWQGNLQSTDSPLAYSE